MTVYLANATVSQADEHKGTLYIEEEALNNRGKLVKRKHPVYLNVWYTDNEVMSLEQWVSARGGVPLAVKAISFQHPQHLPSNLPALPQGVGYYLHVGLEGFTDELLESTPASVTILVRVPEGKKVDMRELVEVCNKDRRVRVIGGNLLAVAGLRVGYMEPGTIKGTAERSKNFVYPNELGSYDNFITIGYSELTGLQEELPKPKKSSSGLRISKGVRLSNLVDKANSTPKPKKLKQSAIKSSFLSSQEVVGF